ncbi:HdeD family acid-resistance protein [Sphingomonas oryzagri]
MATAAGPQPANRWTWTMACGVLLFVAGIFFLAAPGFTTAAIAVLIGWLLLFTGIATVVMGFRSHGAHRRWTEILYGAGSILVGLLVIIDPVAGAASLAMLVAFWLFWRGMIEFGAARLAGPGTTRGMLLGIGAINWVLALLLLLSWPFPAVQMLGVFIGLSFVLGGVATMLAAWQLRSIAVA